MKKQIFIINNGTYPLDTLVCLGQEHAEICNYLKKKFNYILDKEEKEHLWMEGHGKAIRLKNNASILRIDLIKDKALFHSILSHEVFHIVEFLFEIIKLPHSVEYSSEAYAYQIQHLTKQIYNKIYDTRG